MNLKEIAEGLRASKEDLSRKLGTDSSAFFGMVEIDPKKADELRQLELVLIYVNDHARMVSAACDELGQALRALGGGDEEIQEDSSVAYLNGLGKSLRAAEMQTDLAMDIIKSVYRELGFARREIDDKSARES